MVDKYKQKQVMFFEKRD